MLGGELLLRARIARLVDALWRARFIRRVDGSQFILQNKVAAQSMVA